MYDESNPKIHFSPILGENNYEMLDLFHSDVWSINPHSLGIGSGSYFLTCIGHASRY